MRSIAELVEAEAEPETDEDSDNDLFTLLHLADECREMLELFDRRQALYLLTDEEVTEYKAVVERLADFLNDWDLNGVSTDEEEDSSVICLPAE